MTALRAVDAPVITLRDAIDGYLTHLEMAGKAPGTMAGYEHTLRRVAKDLGADRDVTTVTTAQLSRWMQHAWGDKAPNTWNRGRAVLAEAWAYWTAEGIARRNIASPIPRRRVPPSAPKALDRQTIETLLTLPGTSLRERALWALMYSSGARVQEALNLSVQDLRLEPHVSSATVIGKGGAEDAIIFDNRARVLLSEYIGRRRSGPVFLGDDSGPLSYHAARRAFIAATRQILGGGGATLHQLRHSCATHDLEDGMPIHVVQRKLRHSQIATTGIYARTSTRMVRDWMRENDRTRNRTWRRRRSGL